MQSVWKPTVRSLEVRLRRGCNIDLITCYNSNTTAQTRNLSVERYASCSTRAAQISWLTQLAATDIILAQYFALLGHNVKMLREHHLKHSAYWTTVIAVIYCSQTVKTHVEIIARILSSSAVVHSLASKHYNFLPFIQLNWYASGRSWHRLIVQRASLNYNQKYVYDLLEREKEFADSLDAKTAGRGNATLNAHTVVLQHGLSHAWERHHERFPFS